MSFWKSKRNTGCNKSTCAYQFYYSLAIDTKPEEEYFQLVQRSWLSENIQQAAAWLRSSIFKFKFTYMLTNSLPGPFPQFWPNQQTFFGEGHPHRLGNFSFQQPIFKVKYFLDNHFIEVCSVREEDNMDILISTLNWLHATGLIRWLRINLFMLVEFA